MMSFVASKMLAKQAFVARNGLSRGLTATQAFSFSEQTQEPAKEEVKAEEAAPEATQAAPEEPKVEAKAEEAKPEPAAAEPVAAASDSQWGLNYDPENAKFEEEWEAIANDIEAKQMEFLNIELSDLQKKKVTLITEKVTNLNKSEHKYFKMVLAQHVIKASGMNLLKMNMDWPSLKKDSKGTWPPSDPEWFKNTGIAGAVGGMVGQMGGGAQAPAAGGESAAAPEEAAAPKEKTHFDIELSSYDPKGKIKVIKEIRAIFNLGLKEAKETVEGAPVWLKKEVAKEEAEALQETLKAVGAEIRLA